MTAFEFHPLANEFPLMQGQDLDDLIASIKKRGLIEPITMHEGKILDGRNRYRACEAASISAIFEDYAGDDPLGFVIAKNLDRRHLTTSQRAMIAARLANMKRGRPAEENGSNDPFISSEDAAVALKVSVPSVKRAKMILSEGTPEEVASIESGEKTVAGVSAEIGKRRTIDNRSRLNVPDGETVESAVRLGKLSGAAHNVAARDIGMNPGNYAKIYDILRLLDMNLAEEDKSLCRSVLDEINETRRIAAYERLRPLIKRVWGDERHYATADKKRLEQFRRATSVVILGASALSQIETPYLEEAELKELLEDLKAAEGQLRSFRKTLGGM